MHWCADVLTVCTGVMEFFTVCTGVLEFLQYLLVCWSSYNTSWYAAVFTMCTGVLQLLYYA